MATITNDLVSHLQTGEAIAANDAVYINSADGKIYKYDPLDPTQVFAGIAKEAGLLNAFIRVVQSGRVKGFSGLTPGAFVYASVTVPGGFQLTEPGSTLKVVLGIAKSATELTVNGALGIKTGGDGTGSGSLDTILQLTATEQLTDWSTGNNATVLAGGSLAGSFVKETSTPLHGAESYKYTQAAGSLNDYFLSKSFPVDVRFRGQQVYFSAPIQYNGNTGDIQIVIYDVTNATVLTTLSNSIIATNGATQTVIASALLPLTCTSVRVGFQVKVLNSGKIFSFDDIQVGTSLSTFTSIDTQVTQAIEALTPTSTWGSTNTGVPVLNITKNTSNGAIRIDSSATAGTSFVALKACTMEIGVAASVASVAGSLYITRNSTVLTATTPNGLLTAISIEASTSKSTTASIELNIGDVVRIQRSAPITFNVNQVTILATAASDAIVTPTQQISSDTLPFTFKATAIVDADPIGTFNTYTYAANTNTATISGSAPTQTVASMNTNGFQVFTRAYNATSTVASPARVDIKIGKNLKNEKVFGYAGTGKTLPVFLNYIIDGANSQGANTTYNENTGILSIDAGFRTGTATTATFKGAQSLTDNNYTSAYFIFNASTSPSITALPILQPRIAYLSDVKASGTAGGSAAAATTQTRVLNTIVDSYGIVTSLVANQFTLPAGTYSFDITTPGYGVNRHQARLLNITDSTVALNGSSVYCLSTAASTVPSFIVGEVTIASAKTFSVSQYTEIATATNGLGIATSSGQPEVYTICKITKVR